MFNDGICIFALNLTTINHTRPETLKMCNFKTATVKNHVHQTKPLFLIAFNIERAAILNRQF